MEWRDHTEVLRDIAALNAGVSESIGIIIDPKDDLSIGECPNLLGALQKLGDSGGELERLAIELHESFWPRTTAA
jgi:hypothetical protein